MVCNNVQDIVDAGLCMGCGVCEPVCPAKCIEIGESGDNGQLIPIVDQKTCCERCDICLRICPGGEVDFLGLNERYIGKQSDRLDVGVVEAGLVGHASDESLRHAASSGGAATALLVYLLEQDLIDGAVVLRMDPDVPYESQVVVARTREQLLEAKGSKYCPAASGRGLDEVMRQPGRYAFVGVACHIHGVRKFQDVYKKYRDRVVLTLGLFCGGGITRNGTRFLLEQMGAPPDQLVQLTLRGDGFPGKTTAVMRDGRKNELNKLAGATSEREAAVYTSWMHRYFFPPRCLTCTDLTAQLADISFGDPWLKRFSKNHGAGLSMMVTRSATGSHLLQMAIRDGAITIVDSVTEQEIADSQGRLREKIHTRPYRRAARWLGIQTPDYKGLYDTGSESFAATLGAWWQYQRMRLACHRRLWPLLLRLELVRRRYADVRTRWRSRIRRNFRRLLPVRAAANAVTLAPEKTIRDSGVAQ